LRSLLLKLRPAGFITSRSCHSGRSPAAAAAAAAAAAYSEPHAIMTGSIVCIHSQLPLNQHPCRCSKCFHSALHQSPQTPGNSAIHTS
jgi:hypothetical protein